jgi:hypothetical protein
MKWNDGEDKMNVLISETIFCAEDLVQTKKTDTFSANSWDSVNNEILEK